MARGKFLTADEKLTILRQFVDYVPHTDIALGLGRTRPAVTGYLRRIRDGRESPPLLDEETANRLWILLGPSRAR